MSTDLVNNTGVPADESLSIGADDRITRRASGRRRHALPPGLLRLIGPLLVLAVWWTLSATGILDEHLMPAPGTVVQAAIELIASGSLQQHLLVSLARAMSGLAIGVGVGVVLALVTGLSRVGEVLLDSNIQMLRAMPILALMPLAIVWLGIGEELKVTLVALAVMFPIYLNTHAGIRSVDARYIDLARTVGLGRFATIRRIVLPGALAGFFTGLRFSVAIAWLVLVVSEQVNAASGIGYLMTQARSIGRIDIIVVGLVIYATLGLLSDGIVRVIEGRALQWRSTL
ncbi:MAG: ABC transporter permease [Microbacteriaceae bacterium]